MDIAGMVLVWTGTALILLAAAGLLRMPDLYLRISAVGKGSSLGVSVLLAGAALLLRDEGATLRVLLIAAFVLLTTPVAAHIIGRAGYRSGVKLWKGSIVDEYAEAAGEERGGG
jgi:multicomponent Na+:H+ antiporter subunit G